MLNKITAAVQVELGARAAAWRRRRDDGKGDGDDDARDMSLKADTSSSLGLPSCNAAGDARRATLVLSDERSKSVCRLPVRGVCGDPTLEEIRSKLAPDRCCCSQAHVRALLM
jgi:hypothetical protein